MAHFNDPPELPPKALAEGVGKKDARKMPRKRHAFRTVLDRLDELQTIIMDKGADAADLGFEAKRGVLMGHLSYVEAMYDDTLSPFKKAELASRMVPFFNLSREMVPKDTAKYPSTEKMIDGEILAKVKTMGKLHGSMTPETKELLKTLSAAAEQPPAEA